MNSLTHNFNGLHSDLWVVNHHHSSPSISALSLTCPVMSLLTAPRDLCLVRYWKHNDADGSYVVCLDSTFHLGKKQGDSTEETILPVKNENVVPVAPFADKLQAH